MTEEATISTVISADVKRAISEYCKRKGLKLRYVIEQAIVEKLEDEIDLESYRLRQSEPTISLEDLLAGQ